MTGLADLVSVVQVFTTAQPASYCPPPRGERALGEAGMKRLRIFVSTIAVLLAGTPVFSGEAYLPPPSDRVRTNIDLGWKFLGGDLAGEEETHQVTDVVWESVDLPHDFCRFEG